MHSRHRHTAIAQLTTALDAAHRAALGLLPLLGLMIRCLWP